jgi:hypothetical protein
MDAHVAPLSKEYEMSKLEETPDVFVQFIVYVSHVYKVSPPFGLTIVMVWEKKLLQRSKMKVVNNNFFNIIKDFL